MVRPALALTLALGLLAAAAEAAPKGFALHRHQPTGAGEWFFTVERPLYASERWFAAGFTLDYAHDPLVGGRRDSAGRFVRDVAVVEHALVGHLDLAGSFWDRLQVSATLPVALFEAGTAAAGVAPIQTAVVGDPRVGFALRLYGHTERDRFSIHLGAQLWIPVGSDGEHQGDALPRGLPKLLLGGSGGPVRWSATVGVLLRDQAWLGDPPSPPSRVGHEAQLALGLGFTDRRRRLHAGPELLLATATDGERAFTSAASRIELAAGLGYLIADRVQVGVAAAVGFFAAPGTPDARLLCRAAWAPRRSASSPKPAAPPPADRDGDGILDGDDACPERRGAPSGDRRRHGCPRDRDDDGIADGDDLCPEAPSGRYPDPRRRGCPLADFDHDGVPDDDDVCKDLPFGDYPDPRRLGCPLRDRDGDGVFDASDVCPDVPRGKEADPRRLGCPLDDHDGDTVPDDADACPEVPGAPDPAPAKNGCPGLVEVRGDTIVLLEPVHFATNRDVILPDSYPLLGAVAHAIRAQVASRPVTIEGHTDDRGSRSYNLDLSARRARSCLRFLVEAGIPAARLRAEGYGPDRPVAGNDTPAGRAKNRRVEFRLEEAPR